MSVSKERIPWLQHILYFNSMAKNAKDNASFYVWIAKLWEYDKGLTVKYMNIHGNEYSPANREIYHNLLKSNGMDKWCLP